MVLMIITESFPGMASRLQGYLFLLSGSPHLPAVMDDITFGGCADEGGERDGMEFHFLFTAEHFLFAWVIFACFQGLRIKTKVLS